MLLEKLVEQANAHTTVKYKQLEREKARLDKLAVKCGGVVPQAEILKWNDLCQSYNSFTERAGYLGGLLNTSIQVTPSSTSTPAPPAPPK